MSVIVTELHRHLDVSVRLSTLLSLAQDLGHWPKSTTLEEFRKKVVLTQPLASLDEVIETFDLFPKVMDREEIIERIAFEVAEDCWREGTQAVELRYSPSFITRVSGLAWAPVLFALERGLARAMQAYPGLQAGLICIATREFGMDLVERTIEFFLDYQSHFIALDLAGSEQGHPCKQYENAFREPIRRGAAITVHAGEATGPENIWEAIEYLGAQRIGHGIACVQDPALMRKLAERRICLEICPTSNWLTGAVPSLAKHPLPQILRAGVPVSVNTDDPAVFGVTLPLELENCRKYMGLSEDEITACLRHAESSSFLLHKSKSVSK